jgi:hypothetical protein
VLPYEIAAVWVDVQEMVAEGLRRGRSHWGPLNVLEQLFLGNMHLWLSKTGDRIEACCVTQILIYPTAKVCSVFVISGENRGNWMKFEHSIAAWGKAQGCEYMEGYGRKGWGRISGWEPVHTLFRRAL